MKRPGHAHQERTGAPKLSDDDVATGSDYPQSQYATIVSSMRRWAPGILLGLALVGAGALFAALAHQSTLVVQGMALQGTELQVKSISAFRQIYSAEVVGKAIHNELEVTHDYKDKPGAIPLPASLTKELGAHVEKTRPGAHVRLYSDFPFPWRAQIDHTDAFAAAAIKALQRDPDQPFYRFESFEGRSSLRYAIADTMSQGCVNCHNSHPDSPKRDWKVGDVRGVLEFIRPLDNEGPMAVLSAQGTFRTYQALAGLALGLGVLGLGYSNRSLRRSRATLQHQSQVLDEMGRVARVGGWEFEPSSGRITWTNQIYKIFELPRTYKPELSKDLAHFPIESRDIVTGYIQRAIEAGEPFDYTLPFVTANGRELWVRGLGKAERRADGTVRLYGAFQDVTESELKSRELGEAYADLERRVVERTAQLSETKQAAEGATHAKSEFLATMSHELRTPLNGLIGMTELMLRTNLDTQQRRYAQLAKSSGDALLSLINDILDFSKIEAGKLELEYTNFDLWYAVESVAASLVSRAEGKGVELIVGMHPEVPPLVRGDPGRLQQVLLNLVNNAIKFTESGEVSIRAKLEVGANLEEENDQRALVRFNVRDTGIGIPQDRLTVLFESFSQVDASTTRKYGGTGLGLAICKRLVELMGGQIGASSEEGEGSTFWFMVPFEKQASDGALVRSMSGVLRNLRVLIVDDNATSREILQEQLTSWGMDHRAVAGGHEALAALRDGVTAGTPFGLALLDMQMPGMNGRELAQAIKADARIQDTVLILLTSSQEEQDPKQFRSEGFAEYAVKPVRPSQLLDTITEAVAWASAPSVGGREVGQAPPAKPLRMGSGRPTGARILLAEDHPISQEVATTILRQAGYQCDAVADGRQALEAVMAQQYDLVLMDCQMPEMDGFMATQAIRQAEQAGQIKQGNAGRLPIIALTANAVKGDRECCLDAGMDDYLTKPLDPDRLIEVIQSWLAKTAALHTPDEGPRPLEPPPPLSQPSCLGPTPDPGAAPALPQPEARPPFDLEMLRKQWGGDPGFVLKLISKFQKQALSELQQIEQSIAAGDAERTTQLAHGLKGAASYLCAPGVRESAAQLEAIGCARDVREAGTVLRELRVELQRCLDFCPETATPTATRSPDDGVCDANYNL